MEIKIQNIETIREAARQFINANALQEKGLVIAFYGKMGAAPSSKPFVKNWVLKTSLPPPPSPSSTNTASPLGGGWRGLSIISISTASRRLRKSTTWAMRTISTAAISVSSSGRNSSKTSCPRMPSASPSRNSPTAPGSSPGNYS